MVLEDDNDYEMIEREREEKRGKCNRKRTAKDIVLDNQTSADVIAQKHNAVIDTSNACTAFKAVNPDIMVQSSSVKDSP